MKSNNVLIVRAFNIVDNVMSSAFKGNPFSRTYKMFAVAQAPEDFPFYIMKNAHYPNAGTVFNATVACVVNQDNIRQRQTPFFAGKLPSFEAARKNKDYYVYMGCNLSVTRMTPVATLVYAPEAQWGSEPPTEFRETVRKLKEISELSGIPIWSGYNV
jgi:hypothetical protein